jgi:hypothetical protein
MAPVHQVDNPQKFVAFLDDMTERETRSGIPGQATRCEDVAREQGVDEAHARSRVRPCVRAHGMRAESSRRPAVATADPLRRAGQEHLCGVRLTRLSSAQLSSAQLSSRMWSLSKASSKIAFGGSGSCRPFQSRWVVS